MSNLPSDLFIVPLNKLSLSEKNVRKGDADKKLDCFISSSRGSDDTRPG
jgi:hypothetical protein